MTEDRYMIDELIRSIDAALSAPVAAGGAPAPTADDVPTGVGDSGKEPFPPDARMHVLTMPSRMNVVSFKCTDREGYASEVHGYTLDVTNGKPTRIRTRGWSEEASPADLHSLVMTWFDHEMREQLGMEPHAPAPDAPQVAAETPACICVRGEDGPDMTCPVHGDNPSGKAGAPTTWRVGRKLGRTIYRDDVLVGVMDTADLAQLVVDALSDPSPLRAELKTMTCMWQGLRDRLHQLNPLIKAVLETEGAGTSTDAPTEAVEAFYRALAALRDAFGASPLPGDEAPICPVCNRPYITIPEAVIEERVKGHRYHGGEAWCWGRGNCAQHIVDTELARRVSAPAVAPGKDSK